jgi:hypothetical protein
MRRVKYVWVVAAVVVGMVVLGLVGWRVHRSSGAWLERSWRMAAQQEMPESRIAVFSAAVDLQWLPRLRHMPFAHVAPFMSFDAYADKFLVRFVDGNHAMLKLLHHPSLLPRSLLTVEYNEYVACRACNDAAHR